MRMLSVVTITLNEAERLERCRRSIEWAGEWVVVDSGSTDGTVALARRLSARVYERPFDNFSNQKNYAVEQARGDWVLMLDADERVSPGLRDEIELVLRRADGPSCYAMPRQNMHFGRWLKYGGQYPDWSYRLFRKGTAHLVGDVHEQLEYLGDAGRLRHPIVHHSFPTLADWIRKMDRQTTHEAGFAFERGARASWADVTLRPVYWFLRMYIAQRGFLDGGAGFVHSVCTFICIFFRYAKLRELRTRRAGGSNL
ncbi:MAG: glycosyltransferase family 2 protein [Chloroflexi bacterium]|nr:glycosyltransferase family 2 protein [Chloroflexota bacterium]